MTFQSNRYDLGKAVGMTGQLRNAYIVCKDKDAIIRGRRKAI